MKTISSSEYIYFETQNLYVRQYGMNDIDGIYQIMSNPKVHQYTKDKNHPWDRLKTEQYIQFFMEKNLATLDYYHGAIIEKTKIIRIFKWCLVCIIVFLISIFFMNLDMVLQTL